MNKEKYINEMEDYLYNHNYISQNNNNIKQQELSLERASCIVQKYRTLTEEKDKEIEQLKKQKDDVVELIIKLYQKEYNKTSDWWLQEELCNNFDDMNIFTDFELERMLGEIDE